MLKAKLEETLFIDERRAYAVLDGASIPDLLQKLYELSPRSVCLYRGEIEPDIAEVAPYLVELQRETPFTGWLLSEQTHGRHFGIFAGSSLSMTEARKHFRRFLTVYDESGKPLLFRYYDPRVLTKFLPTCDRKDLGPLFAGIDFYLAENGAAGHLRFRLQNGKLHSTNL